MYSCEKLARGASGGIICRGKISERDLELHAIITEVELKSKDKYQYNFGDARKCSVLEEIDKNRPKGRLYRSRIR